jgi:PKD repeat protein
MKNIFTFLFALILTGSVTAQVFWTENFGTNCIARGSLASAYSGVNGAWIVTSTGTNDASGNDWYINDRISYNGIGNCATGNDASCTSNNNSLHIGGVAVSVFGVLNYPADSASYWTGFFSQYGYNAATSKRCESPAINCSGKSNITLSFVYYEGGDYNNGDPNGDATLWYYDGSTWAKISDMVKLSSSRPCQGTMYGIFGTFSIVLPSSANNNPNVKIGFNWFNNNLSAGTDPSFAVDSIQVSGSGSVVLPPVAKITTIGDTSGCTPLCLGFSDNSTNSPTSWLWTFNGGIPASSTLQSPGGVCWNNAGTYSVKLKVSNSGGTDSVTLSNYFHAIAAPPVPTITQSNDTLCCSYNVAYTAYQWYEGNVLINGATNPCYKVTHPGSYNVSVSNSNGCQVAVGTTVGVQSYTVNYSISLFPSPAKNELTIEGDWQARNGKISLYDILGNKIREEVVSLDHNITYNVKNLSQGVYFIHVDTDNGRWTGKFIKE